MAIGDMPLVDALKTKMRWNQARQRVLSENVANADTPRFRSKDLKAIEFKRPGTLQAPQAPMVAVATTAAEHIAGRPLGYDNFRADGKAGFETTPNGNAVNLEEEMTKVADTQMDFHAVASMYQRSLGVIRTAIGKKG